MVRVFANSLRDLSSIPDRVIPNTKKMVLDAPMLKIQYYKVRTKVRCSNQGEKIDPSLTPWCSSYRKGGLRVTLDYGRQLYLYIHICIYK